MGHVGKRLALLVAAGTLAAGIAQAPASADEAGARWLVGGESSSECSGATGDYTYSRVPGSTNTYSASWNLYVYDSCPSAEVAHLRVEYDEWNGYSWVHTNWKTIATSAGNDENASHLPKSRNAHFKVCDYTSSRGNHNCLPVT
ncbi:hypothetical protein [Streptomyces sp. NPDC088360]|uniref:hypothetical protein n=1 Tax=Streptomyces sp. NPDC088360 TaxID=3154515 RepID=UPI00344F1442